MRRLTTASHDDPRRAPRLPGRTAASPRRTQTTPRAPRRWPATARPAPRKQHPRPPAAVASCQPPDPPRSAARWRCRRRLAGRRPRSPPARHRAPQAKLHDGREQPRRGPGRFSQIPLAPTQNHEGHPDAAAARPRNNAPITPTPTIQLLIELDATAEPITGTVQHGPEGDCVNFRGWLALTQAIETIRRAASRVRDPQALAQQPARDGPDGQVLPR